MKRFICGLFATIGLLCVLFSGPITTVLPYILGGTMTAVGIAYGIVYFRNSENRAGRASELSSGLVLFVVGALCIVHGVDSIGAMGTTWAIFGLLKASSSLTRAIQNSGRGLAFYTAVIEFLVRLTFSVMLLFYPVEKFQIHIVLLGLELIAIIAIQEIIKEYQRQKTNQRSRKGGSARKPQQYHAEAEVII